MCKKWRRLVNETLVADKHLTLVNKSQLNANIFSRMPNLTSLQLIACDLNAEHQQAVRCTNSRPGLVTLSLLSQIIKHLRKLERLELNSISFSVNALGYGEFLKQLFIELKSISHLSINSITEQEMATAAPFSKKLQQFHVDYRNDTVANGHDLNGYKHLLGANSFTKLNCPIKVISAVSCDISHPIGLIKNSIVKQTLSELYLKNCEINYSHFKQLIKGLVNLSKIHCELKNEPITEKNLFYNKFQLNNQLLLREIVIKINNFSENFNEIKVVNCQALASIIKNCNDLVKFELHGGQITNDTLKKFKNCHKLEILRLSNLNSEKVIRVNDNIDDEGFNYITELTQLKQVTISGTLITESSLMRLIENTYDTLIHLDISGCQNVNYDKLVSYTRLPHELDLINEKTLKINEQILIKESNESHYKTSCAGKQISLACRLFRMRSQLSLTNF